MCCFSQPIERVAGTKIFARLTGSGTQLLAYEMDFTADGELAMILPLPVRPGAGEGAVRFIDLSGYPRFFHALAAGFPAELSLATPRSRMVQAAPTLVVHDVGSFVASYVPTIADFERLDARFRLPTQVWDGLPGYADYGFAVFKLKDERSLIGRMLGRERNKIHPLALELPTRAPERAFFPTLHVHDGRVHPTAEFDHTLYLQREGQREGPPVGDDGEWEASVTTASGFVDIAKAQGLVLGGAPCLRRSIDGEHENADIWA